jgi:hypothetical protein
MIKNNYFKLKIFYTIFLIIFSLILKYNMFFYISKFNFGEYKSIIIFINIRKLLSFALNTMSKVL